ncbi:MAG TPA: molybdopterin-dependent oxidoreductase [Anaerolineales bacterium]|nr:molybdopterin-dependent oxidoreductase [Anaerolineales bacterium]
MSKKFILVISTLLILAVLLSACGGAASDANTNNPANAGSGGGNGSGGGGGDGSGGGNGSGGGAVALKVSGMVDQEMAWTEEEVHAMETMDAVSTNKAGDESTYTGVSLNALLAEAGVQDGAATVIFVADDGYEAEVSLEELSACSDCIVSFRNQGGFSTVLPGFPGSVQVKGVVEIVVK